VAGKELLENRIGGWIRPVSGLETGELSIKETSYKNEKIPELLDIISMPLVKHSPNSYQTENYLVGDRPWVKKGQMPIADLERLRDNVDCLWINGYNSHNGLNDRMPQELVEERLKSSLLFIKPERICVTVEEGANLLTKVRSKFTFGGTEYWLSITDPVIENRFFHEEMGEYLIDRRDLYLTISIGEPYNGFCYKLVAGIFNFL